MGLPTKCIEESNLNNTYLFEASFFSYSISSCTTIPRSRSVKALRFLSMVMTFFECKQLVYAFCPFAQLLPLFVWFDENQILIWKRWFWQETWKIIYCIMHWEVSYKWELFQKWSTASSFWIVCPRCWEAASRVMSRKLFFLLIPNFDKVFTISNILIWPYSNIYPIYSEKQMSQTVNLLHLWFLTLFRSIYSLISFARISS